MADADWPDLETARQVVSDAERDALDRADLLRQQAEEILESLDRSRRESEAQIAELRADLQTAREEAEKARAELAEERRRASAAGPVPAPADPPAGNRVAVTAPNPALDIEEEPLLAGAMLSGLMDRMTGDAERLLEAAGATAARLHDQAETGISEAKGEAERILAAATKEAEDLLTAAVAAIERDTAIAQAARDQADRDAGVAAERRRAAEALLARASDDARQIVTEAGQEAEDRFLGARNEGSAAGRDRLTAERIRLEGDLTEVRGALERAYRSIDRLLSADAGSASDADDASMEDG